MPDLWTPLPPDEFIYAFESYFASTAFRLEQLDAYVSDEETEPFRRWRNGQPGNLAWRQHWLDMLRASAAAGKAMTRVRVVTEPWTPYTEWELTACYPSSVEAGEDIRILPRQRRLTPSHDFWLFDAHVCRMRYDHEGGWHGADVSSSRRVLAEHRAWARLATNAATPLDDYLTETRRATA